MNRLAQEDVSFSFLDHCDGQLLVPILRLSDDALDSSGSLKTMYELPVYPPLEVR
jgi:hypothetical protein